MPSEARLRSKGFKVFGINFTFIASLGSVSTRKHTSFLLPLWILSLPLVTTGSTRHCSACSSLFLQLTHIPLTCTSTNTFSHLKLLPYSEPPFPSLSCTILNPSSAASNIEVDGSAREGSRMVVKGKQEYDYVVRLSGRRRACLEPIIVLVVSADALPTLQWFRTRKPHPRRKVGC